MDNYAPEAPMHLFGEIDQKRGFWMRLPNYLKYRSNWRMGGLMLGALSVLLVSGLVVNKLYSVDANQAAQLTSKEQSASTPSQINIKTYNQVTQTTEELSEATSSNTLASETATPAPAKPNTRPSQTKLTDVPAQLTAKTAIANNPEAVTKAIALPKRDISIFNTQVSGVNASADDLWRSAQNSVPNGVVYIEGVAQAASITNQSASTLAERKNFESIGLLSNTTKLERLVGLSEEDASQWLPKLKCPEPDNGKFIYYIDALVSPDYAITEIAGRTAAYDNYAAARRATENFNYAFSAGVRVSAVTKAGLAFRTGVIYSQITEKFDHTGDSEEIDSIVTVVDGQGMILSQDTTFVQITTQNNNHFKLLDIPLIVGYETYMLQNRLVLTFNGGMYFNISSTPVGKILDPDLEPKRVEPDLKGSLMPFKNNFGVSFYGSIGVGYRFNDKLAFLVEPHFRSFLKPITKTDYELKQGYLTTGLTTGLRLQF